MLGLGLGLHKTRKMGGLDPDALAFIAAEETAGATLNANQKDAINKLFLNLKGQGPDNNTVDFWTTNKVKKWWPLVGGIAAANQIDVRLNAGVFNGGWTHSADGAKGNGSNTFFNSFTAFTGEATGDWGWGNYMDEYSVGEWFSGYIRYAPLRISGCRTFFPNGGYYARGIVYTYVGDTFTGGRMGIRVSGDIECIADSTFIGSASVADDGDDTFDFYFGAINNAGGGAAGSVNSEFRSMYITYGVTRAEAILIQNIDNAFQTQLGRNTY